MYNSKYTFSNAETINAIIIDIKQNDEVLFLKNAS